MVLGGGVVETGVSILLTKSLSTTLSTNEAITRRAFAQALEKNNLRIIETTTFSKTTCYKIVFAFRHS